MDELGQVIKQARKNKKITRKELANKFKDTTYPISYGVIERLENGKNKMPPSIWLLQRLAYLLELNADELYKLAGYTEQDF